MLSRLFWIGIAGIALVTGMVLQDGDRILRFVDDRTGMSSKAELAIEAGIDRAVDRGVEQMQIVGPDGNELDVSPQARHDLGDAVGRLLKAESDLAMLRVRDGSNAKRRAATDRRDQARAEVDRIKAEINGQEQTTGTEAVRDQVRAEVRDAIRDAVRN